MRFKSLQACAALDLASALTLAEVWLLMELTSINKEESGFFNRNELSKKISLHRGLESLGQHLDSVLVSLLTPRVRADLLVNFLTGSKRGPWRKTTSGNMVGHQFEKVRDWLVLHGQMNKTFSRTPQAVPQLMDALRRACDDHKAAAA